MSKRIRWTRWVVTESSVARFPLPWARDPMEFGVEFRSSRA